MLPKHSPFPPPLLSCCTIRISLPPSRILCYTISPYPPPHMLHNIPLPPSPPFTLHNIPFAPLPTIHGTQYSPYPPPSLSVLPRPPNGRETLAGRSVGWTSLPGWLYGTLHHIPWCPPFLASNACICSAEGKAGERSP